MFDFKLKTDDQILIVFDGNIFETTGHQTKKISTSPKVCFCTTCEKEN